MQNVPHISYPALVKLKTRRRLGGTEQTVPIKPSTSFPLPLVTSCHTLNSVTWRVQFSEMHHLKPSQHRYKLFLNTAACATSSEEDKVSTGFMPAKLH